jgi:hypothetical protein
VQTFFLALSKEKRSLVSCVPKELTNPAIVVTEDSLSTPTCTLLKGQSHEKVREISVWGIRITMGAESITRAKSIACGRFTANYYTLKLVFWQTKVMVLKDSV